jgi:hypothetical protein
MNLLPRFSLLLGLALSTFANTANAAVDGADRTALPAGTAVPNWPRPTTAESLVKPSIIRAKDLELVQDRETFGGFVVKVGGRPFAIGQNHPMIGHVSGGELRWLDLAQAEGRTLNLQSGRNSLRVSFSCADKDGGHWRIDQEFSPGAAQSSIDVQVEVTVDQERSVVFLPMFTLFPGAGTFGPKKTQGLLAGLEYLEDEPSSSEADIVGPASKRQVPDSLKLTFPLMALQHDERYLALTWQMRPHFSAVFDSPDRLFGSGGHVMGLIYPGSNGKNREEGNLLPRSAEVLRAGQAVTLHLTLFGGLGKSVVPAIEQYVALRHLPPVPSQGVSPQNYVSLAAGGWLDSGLRQNNLFHHAIAEGGFPAQHAADAAVWLDWLASQATEPEQTSRLKKTAQDALAGIPPNELNISGVGHVRYPVASLIYGHVPHTALQSEQSGQALLARFEADGSVRYHAAAGGPDLAKTHYTNEANGLTSRVVVDLLEATAFTGKPELLDAALKSLRWLNKFHDGVPRGAQTWECPLHTPDILASAQMVRAYTLGYELTGEKEFLEQAQYWGWTGVPFVYLVNPTPNPVGLYSTIAVFGATQWKAPVWLGLPVQWCGLVYAEALYRLARHAPNGPWKQLADGITVSGIQQSWPANDKEKQGLLPDSFVLRPQTRNGPAINPATLQACAARYFDPNPVYDFWCFRQNNLRLHAPGGIQQAEEKARRISFQVQPWRPNSYFVLVNGLKSEPKVLVNGKAAGISAPNEFVQNKGWLILRLEGKAHVELSL